MCSPRPPRGRESVSPPLDRERSIGVGRDPVGNAAERNPKLSTSGGQDWSVSLPRPVIRQCWSTDQGSLAEVGAVGGAGAAPVDGKISLAAIAAAIATPVSEVAMGSSISGSRSSSAVSRLPSTNLGCSTVCFRSQRFVLNPRTAYLRSASTTRRRACSRVSPYPITFASGGVVLHRYGCYPRALRNRLGFPARAAPDRGRSGLPARVDPGQAQARRGNATPRPTPGHGGGSRTRRTPEPSV